MQARNYGLKLKSLPHMVKLQLEQMGKVACQADASPMRPQMGFTTSLNDDTWTRYKGHVTR
jgi:uncharacterized membrane protein YcgQ (UPF0703/DUF1980 family)